MNQLIGPKMKVLDPEGKFLQQWNTTLGLCSVLALILDPLFFYIPVIDVPQNCLNLDNRLAIIACVLRSLADILYGLHIIVQFHTAYYALPSQEFANGELVIDSPSIARRYLSSYFIIDILAVLPLPQVAIFVIIPHTNGPIPLIGKELVKYIIILQYIPRLRIFLYFKKLTRNSGMAGAIFHLFLYILVGQVIGALWYLFSIERQEKCWRVACERYNCDYKYLYCGEGRVGDYVFLNSSCPLLDRSELKDPTDFDFGIYIDALQTRVVQTRYFPRKFFYCSWWGLQSLSSLGQNLRTSTFIGEVIFADFISILGLVLFSLLIGNMQKYMQTYFDLSRREEEMKDKKRDVEELMSRFFLPDDLRDRVRRHELYRWKRTRGLELDSFVQNLPKDLRRDINRHLFSALILRVPMFHSMDELLLEGMCDRLKPVLFTESCYLVREGDVVEEMLFVMRGRLESVTTNGGRKGFLNSSLLKTGDFCGEELLPWALDPWSSSVLPCSTRTVRALTDVEAFILRADDLKFIASQFRRLHSKQVQHTFRCKEVRRADNMLAPHNGSLVTTEANEGSASDICYIIEIKDAYLPPWIICSVCDAVETDGGSFEASFMTEPVSIGLNVLLDAVGQKSDTDATAGEALKRNSCVFRIPNTIISPQLRSAYLKGLKYCNESYTASLSPV